MTDKQFQQLIETFELIKEILTMHDERIQELEEKNYRGY